MPSSHLLEGSTSNGSSPGGTQFSCSYTRVLRRSAIAPLLAGSTAASAHGVAVAHQCWSGQTPLLVAKIQGV